ncbi:uncharacterized protein EI90DRAFT_2670474 [Cantharellus anzutake]|uniref:uncharacterized protein n=1 Tax=Cantharellus anzutake TaxID=1750568 RepID=UPI001908FD80|nr:uncharacterized protein EI90DRAFT_2670474 [Cantharellus anzutake]KAF8337605.1 hypothetical protein EI90DRAFT_2670474 [Cantharellus anzutake]
MAYRFAHLLSVEEIGSQRLGACQLGGLPLTVKLASSWLLSWIIVWLVLIVLHGLRVTVAKARSISLGPAMPAQQLEKLDQVCIIWRCIHASYVVVSSFPRKPVAWPSANLCITSSANRTLFSSGRRYPIVANRRQWGDSVRGFKRDCLSSIACATRQFFSR